LQSMRQHMGMLSNLKVVMGIHDVEDTLSTDVKTSSVF
jgi:hypothetical protein